MRRIKKWILSGLILVLVSLCIWSLRGPIGWTPFDTEMRYKIGFLQAYRPSTYSDVSGVREEPTRMDSDALLIEKSPEGERYTYAPVAAGLHLADYQQYCRSGCTADETHFEAMVVVSLDSDHVDVWTINEKKELILVRDGTK